jgi:hypothetical protein
MSPGEQMKRRLAGLPPPCVSASQSPKTLSVYLANGERWGFQWGGFVQVKLGEDELALVFSESEVVVRGTHLGEIMDSVLRLEVETLREYPPEYRAVADAVEPLITGLEVRARVRP